MKRERKREERKVMTISAQMNREALPQPSSLRGKSKTVSRRILMSKSSYPCYFSLNRISIEV